MADNIPSDGTATNNRTSSLSRFLRNGVLVSASSALAVGLRFARNVILAHMLSQGDFGVCVAMTTLWATVVLLTNFGFEKLLIQEREIDDQKMQPVLTGLVALRMALAALLLFVTAAPMARLLGVPEAIGTFRVLALALIPLGFLHLDTTRFQKEYRFLPDSIVTVAFPVFDLVLTVGAVYFFQSYKVIPITLVISGIATMAVSFRLAERPYRMSWNRVLIKRALRFSMPLLLDGMIIVMAGQADRIVIGGGLGVISLAIYGATMAMISAPTALLMRIETALFLPRLADAAPDQMRFRGRYLEVGAITNVVPVIAVVPLMIFGQELVTLLFGSHYHPQTALIWIVAISQVLALVRLWPNMGALARGDTKNVMLSNLYRTSGIFLAIAVAGMHMGLIAIAAAFAVGELIGTVGAFAHLFLRRPELKRGTTLQLTLVAAATLVSACVTQFLAGALALKALMVVILVASYLFAVVRSSDPGRQLFAKTRTELMAIYGRLGRR